jgi:dihydropteroate synthase
VTSRDDAQPWSIAPGDLGETRIGPSTFRWGERTYIMGIVNVTPDSFAGDGLLGAGGVTAGAVVEAAVAQARAMVEDGADLLDVGGESTRPGHTEVDAAEEAARVVPVLRALRAALPQTPLTIDTTKPAVAAAALEAGADAINDVWGVAQDDAMARVAAEREVPLLLMHNRAEPRYANLLAEVVGDLEAAVERAVRAGVARSAILVDPGFGFGKTADQNLALLGGLAALRRLGRPIVLGTSRKSTLGKVLDLPPEERLEATLATTALGIATGVDVVRVHDVRANVRAARVADAIVRGRHGMSDRIILAGMRFEATHGVHPHEKVEPQRFEVDVELLLDLGPAGRADALAATVDYGAVYDTTRRIVESTSRDLIEALAESIAAAVLADHAGVDETVVRVRKPEVRLGGPLDYAGVEIRRRR